MTASAQSAPAPFLLGEAHVRAFEGVVSALYQAEDTDPERAIEEAAQLLVNCGADPAFIEAVKDAAYDRAYPAPSGEYSPQS